MDKTQQMCDERSSSSQDNCLQESIRKALVPKFPEVSDCSISSGKMTVMSVTLVKLGVDTDRKTALRKTAEVSKSLDKT